MKKHILKGWLIIVISFVTVNIMGQHSYTIGYPKVIDETYESAILFVSANIQGLGSRNPNYALFVILETIEPSPTIQEVIDWSLDGNGGVISEGKYGEVKLTKINTEFTEDIYGLSPETSYIAYFVTVGSDFETAVIETTIPTSVEFTTEAAPVPPSIVNYTPETGSTGVSVNSTFTLNF